MAARPDEAASSSTPRYQLYVLGPFRLVGDAGPVDLGNKKLCGLVAYLACAAGRQRRDRLMSLLWGSHFQLQAQQNLRKALFRLRRTLGTDIIEASDELVWLRPGAVACDAAQFEGLIEQGTRDSLCTAADLYGDLFLSNLSIHEDAWGEWLTGERSRLGGLAVDAFVRLGESEEKQRDFKHSLEIAARATAINGLREDAHRVIIRSLAAVGRRAEALKHFDQVAALLKREIDVEPDAATRALADELRSSRDRREEPGGPQPDHEIDDVKAVTGDGPVGPIASTGRQGVDRGACPEALPSTNTDVAAPAGAHRNHQSRWRAYLPFGRPLTARALSVVVALLLVTASCFALVAFRLSPTGVAEKRLAGALSPGVVPITVLPFTRPVDDADSRLVASLIMDDLTNILSRVPNVRLRSLQGAQLRTRDSAAVAEELEVRYVLDGSVRTQNGKLRVNVELISRNGMHVWSDYFERDSAEGDTARDEIVKGIGRSLQVEMMKAEKARTAAIRSDRPDIGELLSIGWTAMFASSSADTLAQAEAAFTEVLRRDPEVPGALIGLAAHHLTMVGDFYTPDGEHYLGEAEQLLDRALRRTPEASPPYFYLGILHRFRGELQAALEAFVHSTELNPSFAPGYAHAGSVLTRLGRMNEALEQIHYAMRISPKDPNFPIWTRFAGNAELESAHDAAALEWYSRALALNPRSAVVHALLAGTLALAGDTAQAAHYAAKFRQLTAGLSDAQRLEMLGASSKRPEEPHRLLDGCRLALALSR